MGLINARNTVQAHLFRERFEVFLAVIIPFVFMLESGYANAYIFGGGHIGLDVATLLSLGRGFALEVFIFFSFRMIRSFFVTRKYFAGVPLFLAGMIAMIVSAGLNLGFMSQSPEMVSVLRAVTQFMPSFMVSIFRFSLGLLFPVGVGLFALYDVSHLITTMLNSSHLESQALIIQRAELGRSNFIKSIKRAANRTKGQFDEIAAADAENLVKAVRSGDLSFGSGAIKPMPASLVTKVTPVQSTAPVSRPTALPPGQRVAPLPLPPLKPSAGTGISQP